MSVASSNSRDESGSGFSIVSLLVGSAGFLLALICLAFETAGFLARREAWQGQKYADAKAPNAALKSAISALKFDPDNIQALYLKAAKLKENDPKFWDSADFKNTI
ncbi:hypothetical protein HYR69_08915, partial [Candidatus Sumerlaeota bacterium]|nr:hypothetical protein [Candidatus Sumerlaeota bacterium]